MFLPGENFLFFWVQKKNLPGEKFLFFWVLFCRSLLKVSLMYIGLFRDTWKRSLDLLRLALRRRLVPAVYQICQKRPTKKPLKTALMAGISNMSKETYKKALQTGLADCTHTHKQTHMHIHIHVCTQTETYAHTHTCTNVHMSHTWGMSNMSKETHVQINTHAITHTHLYTPMYMGKACLTPTDMQRCQHSSSQSNV